MSEHQSGGGSRVRTDAHRTSPGGNSPAIGGHNRSDQTVRAKHYRSLRAEHYRSILSGEKHHTERHEDRTLRALVAFMAVGAAIAWYFYRGQSELHAIQEEFGITAGP